MSQQYQKATYTKAQYDEFGKALVGDPGGVVSEIVSFKMGHFEGYIDRGSKTVLSIDPTLTDIPNAFYTGVPETTYSNGQCLFKCDLPGDAITEVMGPQEYSLLGGYDAGGTLKWVLVNLPGFFAPGDTFSAYAYTNFPVGVAP